MKRELLVVVLIIAFASGCAKKNITGEVVEIIPDNGSPEKVTLPENKEKIIIENKEIIKGNSVAESGIDNIENYTGTFNVAMSGYKGEVFIGVADGAFFGTIRFFNWGNGTPEPLKNLKVNDDRIYFVRSILTKEEIERYGGTATFTQEFFGIFSKDKHLIRGYYRYVGTQDNWEAVKK